MLNRLIQLLFLMGFIVFFSGTLCAQINTNPSDSIPEEYQRELPEPKFKPAPLNWVTPPAGFEPVQIARINGYVEPITNSGILMYLVEGYPFHEVSGGINRTYFQKNKMVMVSSTYFTSDNGVDGVYYKATFEFKGEDFIRYLVFAGDKEGDETLWLNITFKQADQGKYEDKLLKSIYSINLK